MPGGRQVRVRARTACRSCFPAGRGTGRPTPRRRIGRRSIGRADGVVVDAFPGVGGPHHRRGIALRGGVVRHSAQGATRSVDLPMHHDGSSTAARAAIRVRKRARLAELGPGGSCAFEFGTDFRLDELSQVAPGPRRKHAAGARPGRRPQPFRLEVGGLARSVAVKGDRATGSWRSSVASCRGSGTARGVRATAPRVRYSKRRPRARRGSPDSVTGSSRRGRRVPGPARHAARRRGPAPHPPARWCPARPTSSTARRQRLPDRRRLRGAARGIAGHPAERPPAASPWPQPATCVVANADGRRSGSVRSIRTSW